MRRLNRVETLARLRRGDKLLRLDYGKCKFESDGARPGATVVTLLQLEGKLDIKIHGSLIDSEFVLTKEAANA